MSRVLLTGATGFLGSHLLEALLQQGHQVTILKRTTSNTWRINHLLPSVDSFETDAQPLEQAFVGSPFQAVIHTACSYGRNGEPAHQVVESNLLFGLRLLDAAIAAQSQTFINTDTLLPKTLNAYSLSKNQLAQWLHHRSPHIQVINLKIEHMYGPKDDPTKFVSWLIQQMQKGSSRIPLTDGYQLRDFIYIQDVVSAFSVVQSKIATLPSYTDLEVGTGQQTSVRQFAEALWQAYQVHHPFAKTTLGFGDIPLREGELSCIEVNNTPLMRLGWVPTHPLHQGILKTIQATI